MNFKNTINKKNKECLAHNQKKLINDIAIKVINEEVSVEEARNYLIEKLDIQDIQFANDGHILVKLDEQNSEFLWCYNDFEAQNPIKEGTVYGKIKLTSNERKIVHDIALKVFKNEITVSEAQKYLSDNLNIKVAHFSEDGKVYLKLDEQNSEFFSFNISCNKNPDKNNLKSNIKM